VLAVGNTETHQPWTFLILLNLFSLSLVTSNAVSRAMKGTACGKREDNFPITHTPQVLSKDGGNHRREKKESREEKSRPKKKFQFPLPRPHPAPSTENVLKFYFIYISSRDVFALACVISFGVVTYFPAADTEKEADQVGLLLLLELFDILEGTHFCYSAATTTNVSFTDDVVLFTPQWKKRNWNGEEWDGEDKPA